MDRNTVKNQTFDEERALYASDGLLVDHCRFEGPADGESALKESRNIEVRDSAFLLRYPFWHDQHLKITGCEMFETCRAAIWYTTDATITDCRMNGIKALRECADIRIKNCEINSPEFGWSVRNLKMQDSTIQGEYCMMRSEGLKFENVSLKGKYSFQYIKDSVFENCHFDTKDAFWHAKNVVVKNSVVKGEYLAWYCENVVFENCEIIGTQPLCYCKQLKLINCKMLDTDLAFEKSEVEAEVIGSIDSVKNPAEGTVRAGAVKEIIMDDPHAQGTVVIDEKLKA